MASELPVVKNGTAGATFYIGLLDMGISGSYLGNPTLDAGDVQISLDGGSFSNLATLPVVAPSGGHWVKVVLSQAETNADNISIQFIDQSAPKAFCDCFISIQTAARRFDDLSFPVTSGRGTAVDATGHVGVDWANVGSPATVVGLTNTTIATVTTLSGFTTGAVNAMADGFLDRNMATGTDSGSATVRTVRQALRPLRNKWTVAAGSYQVTKEDDITVSWTSSVTGTSGADPITASDPA